MQKLVVTSVLLLWMAVPAAANSAVREKLAVQYGSAVNFTGQEQALELDLYRPPERRKPRAVVIWVHGGLIDPEGVEQGDSPMLLVHGDADATVPFGASEQVCAAAKKARVSSKLVRLAGGDHLIPYNQFDRVVQVTADWVRERL